MKNFILFSLLSLLFMAVSAQLKPQSTPAAYSKAYTTVQQYNADMNFCKVNGDYHYALIFRDAENKTQAIRFHTYRKGLKYYNLKINYHELNNGNYKKMSQRIKIRKSDVILFGDLTQ